MVEHLHEHLLAMMKDAENGLDYQGRYERVYPVIKRYYDTSFMAKMALGRQWNTLTEDERREWLELFRRHLSSTYAGRFTGWSGHKFVTRGSEPAASIRSMIPSRTSTSRRSSSSPCSTSTTASKRCR